MMSAKTRRTKLLELDHYEPESIIVDATGELQAIDAANEEFAQLLIDSDRENVLQPDGLVNQYEKYCRKRAQEDLDNFREDLAVDWKQEADTWALVCALLSDRYGVDDDLDDNGDPVQQVPPSVFCSDFGHSYEVSKAVREHIIVKQWLESIAPEFQPVEVRKGYYPHTSMQIRGQQRLQGVPNQWNNDNAQIVSELDPDAPSRQHRRIAPEDQSYETELLRTIYEYLRRGRLADAFHLCRACDQSWRIASMGGGAFRDDPFVDGVKDTDVGVFEGNENRVLWKAICYQIALDDNTQLYERAIYAVLAGDIKNALPACHTWEDHIWVRYHAMIESLTSKSLSDIPTPFLTNQELCLPLPHISVEPHIIFTELSKSENARISQEAAEPFHIIQAHLILDSLDMLFASLHVQLVEMERDTNTPSIFGLSSVLRFTAHLILLLRGMGISGYAENSEHVDFLLSRYIHMLHVAGKGDLIAMYVAYLPSEMQVDCYSSFLQDVDDDLQIRCALVTAGIDCMLDMPRICRMTVEKIFRRSSVMDKLEREVPLVTLCGTADTVPESDLLLIRALEWLDMDDMQLEDRLDHANLLARHFLIQGHVQSVYRLVQDIGLPIENFRVLMAKNAKLFKLGTEWLQNQSLVECLSNQAKWSFLFFQQKPQVKDDKPTHKTLEWQGKVKSLTTDTVKKMRVLLENFSAPDYLDEFDSVASQRTLEMEIIKGIYVPELVMWMHQILIQTHRIIPGNLEQSLELANLVAGLDHDGLYEQFKRSNKLGLFMRAMRESALLLLSQNKQELFSQ
ncbi:hypothetical protein BATDEDRAFT_23684 [Batrachochytrium dendrobatidis JAM81]|uniref:Nuclear pore complex protein n=2 Tax=Batrachochytrium dendrobatidis TaxID=109871 RepID=F4NY16_BATDJ|nr:uncharacterized protein BATDEDRAFT_23684 [Batrachochytrium dendrobatidis JAM81]EGF81935.1 hypothetical protein BATDEDRAFT_23684 [Batrachochytrium dendrobatidis JAM81]KAJ8324411.1 Nucleoporin nup84 [Batrachochytrium dendrobatidis]OAJ40672.1 hypothetical protein BDEG_24379 [Batrachochytrium dendrobatidis JEL423]|eukprot:XP_006677346.1 hypothetical protein BATDEDRAFT_23684 [Batrachochytrium dendrobatidis JAM81]